MQAHIHLHTANLADLSAHLDEYGRGTRTCTVTLTLTRPRGKTLHHAARTCTENRPHTMRDVKLSLPGFSERSAYHPAVVRAVSWSQSPERDACLDWSVETSEINLVRGHHAWSSRRHRGVPHCTYGSATASERVSSCDREESKMFVKYTWSCESGEEVQALFSSRLPRRLADLRVHQWISTGTTKNTNNHHGTEPVATSSLD